MNLNSRIFVAGHNGMVGSAILRNLQAAKYTNLITRDRRDLDLAQQDAVHKFFEQAKPEYVFLAAARVGGIWANNTHPANFIYENITIQSNVIHAAYLHKVKKLLFLGSSCIYPKFAPQPISEESLLTDTLEPTNEAYAIAKIAGLKMCKAYFQQYGACFISAMPTNLYGPKDNFDLKTSHVLPAMIRKFHKAKINNTPSVDLWGTGKAMREFLHVDDLANACVFLMHNYKINTWINVGTGMDCTVQSLAEMVKSTVGYEGQIKWNSTMPDGPPRKVLNIDKITNLGWKASISLKTGVEATYQWFLNNEIELNSKNGHL